MKFLRALVAAVAALAIGVTVQMATAPAASAACVHCWNIIEE